MHNALVAMAAILRSLLNVGMDPRRTDQNLELDRRKKSRPPGQEAGFEAFVVDGSVARSESHPAPANTPETQPVHHRYHHQGQEGGEGQSVDHRPGQWAPEGHVVTPDEDMGVCLGDQGEKVEVEANGQWNEPLLLEVKDRTTISSATTLPYDEPDYEAALTFALSEATRMLGQLRREQLQLRELSLCIRFNDFTEVGGAHRFQHPQFRNSTINDVIEGLFRDLMGSAFRPVRLFRVAFWNLSRLDTQPTLWGTTEAERFGALDAATQELNEKLGKSALMTGAQLALRALDDAHKQPKAKCPFVPQREMVKKLWGTDADPLSNKKEWERQLEKASRHHHGKRGT